MKVDNQALLFSIKKNERLCVFVVSFFSEAAFSGLYFFHSYLLHLRWWCAKSDTKQFSTSEDRLWNRPRRSKRGKYIFFFHSKFLDRICGLRGMALDFVRKLRASIYFRDNLCGLDFNLRILELSIS